MSYENHDTRTIHSIGHGVVVPPKQLPLRSQPEKCSNLHQALGTQRL
jgi:hypothetical protein